ncbi:MAG: PEGA domain-containing protein [Planctomycetota bacterium]
MRFLGLLLLMLTTTPACTWWSSEEGVLISSDPLGAHIHVDGRDTGRTTPSRLLIGGNFGKNHMVELHKKGYRPAVRHLYQYTEGYTSKWIDGAYDAVMPPLPLFWSAGDFVFPFGIRGAIVPSELYVKLYSEGSPLLGFELLASQAVRPVDGAR